MFRLEISQGSASRSLFKLLCQPLFSKEDIRARRFLNVVCLPQAGAAGAFTLYKQNKQKAR